MAEGERVVQEQIGAGKKVGDVEMWRKEAAVVGQSQRWLGGRCAGYA